MNFEEAVAKVNGLKSCDNDTLLDLYAYYKQATIGQCNIESPGVFNIKATKKYQAWKGLGDMDSETAKSRYIRIASNL